MAMVVQTAIFAAVMSAFILPLLLLCLVIKMRSISRRNPLTKDLLRPPGYSLARRIDDVAIDLDAGIMMASISGPMVLLAHVLTSYLAGYSESVQRTVASSVVGIGWLGMSARHVMTQYKEKRRLKLGLDGELFVGEQLNQLMLHGCRVFHDIPYEYGNIDHVVVSPSGVFSVNTKMHSKTTQSGNNAEVTVDYPAGKLVFPDCRIPLPFPQLDSEAKWLSRFLTDAAGFSVAVEPMLALPGWFVKHTGRNKEPYVFSIHRIHSSSSSTTAPCSPTTKSSKSPINSTKGAGTLNRLKETAQNAGKNDHSKTSPHGSGPLRTLFFGSGQAVGSSIAAEFNAIVNDLNSRPRSGMLPPYVVITP